MSSFSRRRRRQAGLGCALAGALLLGCSSPAPRPDPEPGSGSGRHQAVNPLAGDDDTDLDGMKVEGTLGTLDEESIQAGLAPSVSALDRCFKKQLALEPYLGGDLTLQFRVARDGSIKRVRISASSIGSIAVERCALAAVAGARFMSPRGGEAEFSYPLKFQSRVAAQAWDPGMVKEEMLARVEQLLTAADKTAPPLRAPAGLAITFYVDRKGKVVSAGMIAEDAVPAEFADQFLTNLKQLTFEAATGGYAKVTYSW